MTPEQEAALEAAIREVTEQMIEQATLWLGLD